MIIDERYMTPAMMALSPKRRLFVLAMASDPLGTAKDWAIAAGYSDTNDGAKVRAWEAIHDAKVQAAVQDIARITLGVKGPLIAVDALLNMARDGKHPRHDRAVEMILNRTGMAEKQEIEVTHRDLTGDALLARLHALAGRLGLDAEKLLGMDANVGQPKDVSREAVKVIEHDEGGGEVGS